MSILEFTREAIYNAIATGLEVDEAIPYQPPLDLFTERSLGEIMRQRPLYKPQHSPRTPSYTDITEHVFTDVVGAELHSSSVELLREDGAIFVLHNPGIGIRNMQGDVDYILNTPIQDIKNIVEPHRHLLDWFSIQFTTAKGVFTLEWEPSVLCRCTREPTDKRNQ